MDGKVQIGFESDAILLKVGDILPMRQVSETAKTMPRYEKIKSSIADVGVIEPPIVCRAGTSTGQYMLLDGHSRIEALKDLGIENIVCLISKDDEAYSYNKHVNQIVAVQEHKMIMRAIERGVSEERIAKALNVNVNAIKGKVNLLKGICPEAEELIKDKPFPAQTIRLVSKMNAIRQVEVLQLMIAVNNLSHTYARALLASTPPSQLVKPVPKRIPKGISAEQLARMDAEMTNLQQQIKSVEATYGPDHLNLILARGYLSRIMGNNLVARYLAKNHPELEHELRNVANSSSISETPEE